MEKLGKSDPWAAMARHRSGLTRAAARLEKLAAAV
jgi:hypothetical protein